MKSLKYILLIFVVMFSVGHLSAQLSVGLRDTRYVNVSYSFLKNYSVRFEQSVYAEKPKCQYFRLYTSYFRYINFFKVSVTPYFGMTYGDIYKSLGADIDVSCTPVSLLTVKAGFTPHYDTGLDYSNLYLASIGINCNKQISLIGTFTNRPEYRAPEKRLRAGVRFTVGKLWVLPEVSIPASSQQGRGLRMLASMNYEF